MAGERLCDRLVLRAGRERQASYCLPRAARRRDRRRRTVRARNRAALAREAQRAKRKAQRSDSTNASRPPTGFEPAYGVPLTARGSRLTAYGFSRIYTGMNSATIPTPSEIKAGLAAMPAQTVPAMRVLRRE